LNTLPQLMIMRALAEARGGEWRPPQYAHLPMVLAEGSSRRLSKRDGAPGVLQLRDAGVLPEAVLGAVARLGFAAPDGVDPCSLDELVGCFDLARVQSSSAHWDGKHLMHLNAQLIQRMDIAELLERLRPRLSEAACLDGRLAALVDLLRPRAQTLVELAGQVEQHFNPPAVELDEAGRAVVRALAEHLGALDDWSESAIDAVIHRLIDELQLPGMAAIGKPMRSALCGSPAGAPVAMLACILGREVSLERLSGAA
ncbi:MAG: hypothetical protein ISN29_10995, partial [Gammaproteobacteria bacterium AqS3]|nr:hypothetical protein [Gammaproteobacteria bacterium AqS3]